MQLRWISLPLIVSLMSCSSIALAAEQAKPSIKSAGTDQATSGSTKAAAPTKKPKLVEINSATAAQLKTVPGIGDAEAERIIKNRPYMTRSHLVTKNVLSYEAYLALKDRITVIPPELPKAKK